MVVDGAEGFVKGISSLKLVAKQVSRDVPGEDVVQQQLEVPAAKDRSTCLYDRRYSTFGQATLTIL